jgi:hypothetical protein
MQIEETTAAAARAVDEAVQAALAEDGTPGELADVYEAAQRTLRTGAPVLYGVGFLGESSFFGEAALKDGRMIGAAAADVLIGPTPGRNSRRSWNPCPRAHAWWIRTTSSLRRIPEA